MALKWNANLVLKVQSIKRSWSRLATALPLHIGCCLPCHAHDLLERVSVSLAELGPVSAEVCRLSCHAIRVSLMGKLWNAGDVSRVLFPQNLALVGPGCAGDPHDDGARDLDWLAGWVSFVNELCRGWSVGDLPDCVRRNRLWCCDFSEAWFWLI